MPDELGRAMGDLTYADISAIPGWFTFEDFAVFRMILSAQAADEPPGDLAELGVYKGKSATMIGAHRRTSESFTVVDLFEDGDATDPANERENAREYAGLSRREFEMHYLSVHPTLPDVVQGPSASIADIARHGAHRFVHIDASHLYDHVCKDIEVTQKLLRPHGVVVLDDYRSAHTPGVAAAAWAAVAKGLRPIVLTSNKLYATWGDPKRWAGAIDDWRPSSGLDHEVQSIAGIDVHRVWSPTPAGARWVPPAAAPLVRALRAALRR